MADKDKRYLSSVEVAEKFGVTSRTVRNWWKSGKTCLKAWHPCHALGLRGLRFTAESVEQLVLSGQICPDDDDDCQ